MIPKKYRGRETTKHIREKAFLRGNYTGILEPYFCMAQRTLNYVLSSGVEMNHLKKFDASLFECSKDKQWQNIRHCLLDEKSLDSCLVLEWLLDRCCRCWDVESIRQLRSVAEDVVYLLYLVKHEKGGLGQFLLSFYHRDKNLVFGNEMYERREYVPFIKPVLWFLAEADGVASASLIDAVYCMIAGYARIAFGSSEIMPADVSGFFFSAYYDYVGGLIKRLGEKTMLHEHPPIETLRQYLKSCRDMMIPPDIYRAEINHIPPRFVEVSDNPVPHNGWPLSAKPVYSDMYLQQACAGFDLMTSRQKEWLTKIQQAYSVKYRDFLPQDFENINRFKFVSRRIVWWHDPNVPYKAYTAYLIKYVRVYKDARQILPKKNIARNMGARDQEDYAVENLSFILQHQNLYPLHPKCITYIRKLLVDVYRLWQWKGERICVQYLVDRGYRVSPYFTFDDCRDKLKLPFDIRAEDKNGAWFLVEYDGEQHYTYPNYWHKTREEYELQIRHDRIKTEYCRERNIPLYRITSRDLGQLDEIFGVRK